jgi:hypothetical protein
MVDLAVLSKLAVSASGPKTVVLRRHLQYTSTQNRCCSAHISVSIDDASENRLASRNLNVRNAFSFCGSAVNTSSLKVRTRSVPYIRIQLGGLHTIGFNPKKFNYQPNPISDIIKKKHTQRFIRIPHNLRIRILLRRLGQHNDRLLLRLPPVLQIEVDDMRQRLGVDRRRRHDRSEEVRRELPVVAPFAFSVVLPELLEERVVVGRLQRERNDA